LAERGRHEEALACYDRALAIRRDIPQVLGNRGNALRNLGRFDEAETSLREALRLKPDFANAHRNLGRVLFDAGRWEEAAAGSKRKPRRGDTREARLARRIRGTSAGGRWIRTSVSGC
jgi:tetratricopeptide (TPR) repeat protein